MPVELVVLLNEEATDEQVKRLAQAITLIPITVGVRRREIPGTPDYRVTHESTERVQ